MSEPCRLRWGEGYGACDDAMMDPSRRGDSSEPKIDHKEKTAPPVRRGGKERK